MAFDSLAGSNASVAPEQGEREIDQPQRAGPATPRTSTPPSEEQRRTSLIRRRASQSRQNRLSSSGKEIDWTAQLERLDDIKKEALFDGIDHPSQLESIEGTETLHQLYGTLVPADRTARTAATSEGVSAGDRPAGEEERAGRARSASNYPDLVIYPPLGPSPRARPLEPAANANDSASSDYEDNATIAPPADYPSDADEDLAEKVLQSYFTVDPSPGSELHRRAESGQLRQSAFEAGTTPKPNRGAGLAPVYVPANGPFDVAFASPLPSPTVRPLAPPMGPDGLDLLSYEADEERLDDDDDAGDESQSDDGCSDVAEEGGRDSQCQTFDHLTASLPAPSPELVEQAVRDGEAEAVSRL
ncbi:hypothetical protein JCM8202v2_003634 [Rhodotorula sphaerocarpa]